MTKDNWIENAIIYQVYPLTFNYKSGSKSDPYKGAYGNLRGVTEKADYIKSLGVDAIWITPFYKWNRNGYTYDITNYEEISPMFGDEKDLKQLISTFHKKGIKVLSDQVLNHCSIEHEWFKKSIKKEDPYTDYFVWQDAKGIDDKGKHIPPTNWPSTWDSSGESVWAWNEERGQFYMHSFDYTMPNLNINNLEVQEKLLAISKYWFDMGIDGFRLDGTCHYGYEPKLLDNPIIGTKTTPHISKKLLQSEKGKQMRIYDINHEIGFEFINKLSSLAKQYSPQKVLLAEYVFDKGYHANMKGRKGIRESLCDTFYTGALRNGLEDFVSGVKKMMYTINNAAHYNDEAISIDGAKINWALSNHDMERVASRWFGKNPKNEEIILAMKLLLSLPGNICIFQGEELGLTNPQIKSIRNEQNDPLELSSTIGMPWDCARASIPFEKTGTNMWLKPSKKQCLKAVSEQEKLPDSILNNTRNAIKWRKENPILNSVGKIKFIETKNPKVISFVRKNKNGDKLLLAFNFTNEVVKIKLPNFMKIKIPPYSMQERKIDKFYKPIQKLLKSALLKRNIIKDR